MRIPHLTHRLSLSSLLLLPALGLLMVYFPTLASGFSRMQMFPDDTVFNHLVMEHLWCWISGSCWDAGFWNPPFGHPLPNIKATSDLMLSFAPLYWIWRLVGIDPWTSFSLWMMSLSVANFAVCYLFLRRCFGVTVLGGSFAAFIFAFASPRTGQLNHQQLLPHLFLLLVVWALMRVFDDSASTRRRAAWLYVAAGSLAAQLLGALYNFEFICIVLLLALVWALAIKRYRLMLWGTARRLWLHGLIALALAAALVAPAMIQYLKAAQASIVWDVSIGANALARPLSWIHVGDHSWLYGWMSAHPPFSGIPSRFEHVLGVGIATTVVALAGLWMQRGRDGVRLMVMVSATVVVLFTLYPGDISLWPLLYRVIPGLEAIRLPVRIGMLLLIPLAVGLGCWLSRERQGWKRHALALAVAALCCVEQGGTTGSFQVYPQYKRMANIMAQFDPRAVAFVVLPPNGTPPSPATELPAMWAALDSGLPTINLHTSAFPNQWPLRDYYFYGDRKFTNRDLHNVVLRWARKHSLDPARVRVVEMQHGGTFKGAWATDFVPTPVPGTAKPPE